MNESQQKPRAISVVAWIIAAAVYVLAVVAIWGLGIPRDPQMSRWSPGEQGAFSLLIPLIFCAYILLIGYVYGDAKRRGMRYVMWTLLAIFIPDAIGIIIYFILRDPLPVACPGCHALLKPGFAFCPHCATSLKPTCPQCGRALDRGWLHCPQCGAAVPGTGQPSATGAQPGVQPLAKT
jgi:hypothetical protein